jgi:tetratricopeptide (TPR) repeat protein
MGKNSRTILVASLLAVLLVALAAGVGLLIHWYLSPPPPKGWQALLVAIAAAIAGALVVLHQLLGIIGSIKELLSARQPAGPRPGRPYMPVRPLPEFVGRHADIRRLEALLEPGSRTAITGLVGMGGLGKTELAKVAAHRVARRFRDGVLWADCGQQELTTIADLWAAQYGRQLPGDDPPAKTAAWRSLIAEREALLIFDNVQPGQEIEPLFPPRGNSAVLLTTRHQQHPVLHGAGRLDLEQFTLAEATALAEEVLGPDEARDQAAAARHLFELTGYLPLAVAVALHLADDCGWPLDVLNGELEAAGALAVLGDEKNLRQSLNATFDTAWDNLPADLQDTFRTLALFNDGPSFSTGALADALALEEMEAGARLHRLAGRSLLATAGEGRWALHPLLRQFAGTRPAVDEAARARVAHHYLRVAAAADGLYLRGGEGVLRGLALFDLEWPHVRAGQAWAAAHAEADDEAARLCSDYPDAGIYCLDLRLHARKRIAWLEAGVRAARRLGDKPAEGNHLGNLGNAHAALGDARRAIDYYQQALAIAREISAASTPGSPEWTAARGSEGIQLGNLGNRYAELGDVQQAMDYYEQALTIFREISAASTKGSPEWTAARRGEGRNLSNLGNAYLTLGNARRAIDYYDQALAIAHEIGDRRGEGNRLGNLGSAYLALEDARRAIGYYEQALTIARETGDRRNEGIQLGNLGNAYAALGDARRAIDYYQQALAIDCEISAASTKGSPEWAAARRIEANQLANMALLAKEQGDVPCARDLWTQALAIYEAIEDPRAEDVRRWLAGT